ncbi:nuclear transcription Y subunit beta [Enteropsectra breve]|nr:nuclear transcription Y subunit beta [Enteropsectra breve]
MEPGEENFAGGGMIKPTDRLLPIANISKIMKGPIPALAKVSKDSKELMQRSASEFIAIVTCRAKDICEIEARKTVTGEDLIRAMEDLDMPYYAELTRQYYEQYRNLVDEKKRKCGDFCGYSEFYEQ